MLQRLNTLRVEADAATERAETAEAKIKELEHRLLEKEQEIASLNHRLGVMETDLDKSEDKVRLYTIQKEEGEQSKSTAESLARKIQLLEEELDTAEKNVKETTEKYVLLACLL